MAKVLLAIILLLSPVSVFAGNYVVLLHGIARSSSSMEDLEEQLQKDGFTPINIDYPSRENTLEALIDIVHEKVAKRATEKNRTIHFIGHSMGNLIIRGYINKYRPKHLGRVVMLAPPNGGSEVADTLKDNWLYRKYYGPAGQQLTTNQENIKKLLGKVDYEVGIIAGNNSIAPVSSLIIPGDDDGRVAIERTKLKGMKEHITVNVTHTFIMSNDEVMKKTIQFLKTGNFNAD